MIVQDIISELVDMAQQIDEEQFEELVSVLVTAHSAGSRIYLAGNIICLPARENDILFVLSGSGNSAGMVVKAEKAKSLGMKVLAVTLQPSGKVGQMADSLLVLPGSTRLKNEGTEMAESIQPVGSSFEQLAFLSMESLVLVLQRELGLSREDLLARHGNLE